MNTAEYDLVITGGGVVGAALACALRHSSFQIALIDASTFDEHTQPHSDDRALALSYSTRILLDKLGVWPQVAAIAEPITSIHVSEQGRFGACRFTAEEAEADALGYVVAAKQLDRILLAHLKTQKNVTLLSSTQVIKLSQHSDEVTLETLQNDGEPQLISSRLLVAADGTDSNIRKLCGVQPEQSSYQQTAIIANIATEKSHRNIAYERFTRSGPLAILPMPGKQCAIVLSVDKEQADTVLSQSDADFLQTLQALIGQRLGRLTSTGERSTFPLQLTQSEAAFTGRVAFIGNALRSIHPLGGQGFNLALRDVDSLAEQLLQAGDEDPGAVSLLMRFARQREPDQKHVTFLTDQLARIFKGGSNGLSHLRAAGLISLDLNPFARKQFIKQMMGMNHFNC